MAESLRILRQAIGIRPIGKRNDFQPRVSRAALFALELPAPDSGTAATIGAILPFFQVLENLHEQEEGPLTPRPVQGYGIGKAATSPDPEISMTDLCIVAPTGTKSAPSFHFSFSC